MNEASITVVIIDDHGIVREGTRHVMERTPGIEVVGEAETGESGAELVEALHPDVVLMDIHLPDTNGIAVTRRLADSCPSTRIVVLTAFGDEDYLHAALAAGASGFMVKTAPADELVEAIRTVHAGGTVVDSRLAAAAPSGGPVVELTDREMEIVVLVAEGMANKAIATSLGISRRTVEGHISRVFAKVGSTSRTELLRYAVEHHWVTMGRGS